MASIITHAIIPVSMAIALGKKRISGMLLFYVCIASMLPDIDVVAFRFGIPYENQFGHRGATHSIAFAFFIAALAAFASHYLRCRKVTAFIVVFISAVSHPLLDALTNGGLGVALFWPFNGERIFLPWQPIEVSPIGVKRFLSARGLAVIKSELITVWVPSISIAVLCVAIKFLRKKSADA